jgi:hypothetical protein
VWAEITTPFDKDNDGSMLLGFSLMEGDNLDTGQPILAAQIGLLIFKLTIICEKIL